MPTLCGTCWNTLEPKVSSSQTSVRLVWEQLICQHHNLAEVQQRWIKMFLQFQQGLKCYSFKGGLIMRGLNLMYQSSSSLLFKIVSEFVLLSVNLDHRIKTSYYFWKGNKSSQIPVIRFRSLKVSANRSLMVTCLTLSKRKLHYVTTAFTNVCVYAVHTRIAIHL